VTTLNYLKLLRAKPLKIRRRYLDDVYGILEGASLGLGRAVVPRHLLDGYKNLEVLNPRTVLELPVNLYYFKQPYYARLHHAVVESLVQTAPEVL
jgi:DNA-binding transcriptional LysR family regulator